MMDRTLLRWLGAVAALSVCLGVTPSARATPPLYVPFPCGSTYAVTQGHNTGSHTDKGSWAWDIGIGVGGELASPADGVVRSIRMSSTSGGCSSSYANDANYVVVDFGDGTEALFLHLEAGSSSLMPGDAVRQGDIVGRVGLTGWVCGAHLHFQIQQTCASPWWCDSVPASFVDFGDPGYGATLTSNNCPVLAPCDAVDGETLIDERSDCFVRETSYWWSEAEGHEGHHYFTYAIDDAVSETYGRWVFEVATAGRHRVEVFVPDEASTTAARYFADPGNGRVELSTIDQSTTKGWVAVGEIDLSVGPDRYVELGDATGESPDDDRRVAFDAIRLVPSDSTGAGGMGGQSAGVGGGATTATGGAGSTGGGAGSSSPNDPDDTADCGCRLAPREDRNATRWAWLALALGLGLRRGVREGYRS